MSDSIERSVGEGAPSFRDIDPMQDVRATRHYRALAMRLAQELPHDEGTANAILDHTRDLARQIRDGFPCPGLSLTPEESSFIRKSRSLNGLGGIRVTLPGNEVGGEAAE